MSDTDFSEPLRTLIVQHMPSMDHVALLVTLRDAPDKARRASDLADRAHLDLALVERALRDLVGSGLISQERDGYQYRASADTEGAVAELADMYHTRPVTLVRALYDRPARAVLSFADAFRIRKAGD